MAGININGETTEYKFRDVTGIIGPIVDRNLRKMFVDTMVEVAKDLAPPPPKLGDVPATGHNRSSISFMTGESASRDKFVYAVGTSSGYGGYLEFGTKRMPARPYFLPAADAAKKEIASSSERDWQS